MACPFLLALTAGGLGGARALAPWPELAGLLPDRLRSLTRRHGRGAGGSMTLRGVIEELHQFPVLQNYFGVTDILVEECDDAERHEAVGQTAEFVESG